MKDSKIAADLAGYLRTIMPSTSCAPVVVDHHHGVRLAVDERFWVDILLIGPHWMVAYLNGRATGYNRRFPVGETYPIVAVQAAYFIALHVAPRARTPMMIPLDSTSEQSFLAWRAAEEARMSEAWQYIEQVATDPATPWTALQHSRFCLDAFRAKLAELDDVRKNPGPGAPTPAGAFSG
ncbi:hypothetical protein VD659_08590 [Herbiconiux sp. 11R-BC]|uniref:hypothetical protein n=1 Tax=Herbiconiux sp. 11R-BC TaxID=3111637 RepID=UPI003BFDF059